MAEKAEKEVYCVCRKPYLPSEFMIECDVCQDWFHGSCVGIEEYQAVDIESYHCPNCQPEHGPLKLKRRRNWHRRDYSELNDGSKAVQSGTVIFINKLKKRQFPSTDEIMLRPKGAELTVDFFERNGFHTPMIVEHMEGLGIQVPSSDFTVADVEKYVGSMRELDVIDVSRQDDIRMKMREWTEYYESSFPRKRVFNVISLEFSETELSKLVSPPSVVSEIDWIERHWPKKLPEDCLLQRPQVQKYCLMSVKDSYTDFHVDFGGTSVWYHIIKGKKVFYLIPPTEENLIHYEQWVMSSNQSEVFFGDLVPHCYQCTVLPGNTLFIPTGWIHAVLTPEDSLVFGGNFLHRFNAALQLRIYIMERRLDTPEKFLHPCYEALTWFAAQAFCKKLREHLRESTVAPEYLLNGAKEMALTFKLWTENRDKMKLHKREIPPDIQPERLIQQLARVTSKLETPMQPVLGVEGKPEGLKFRIRKSSMGGSSPPHPPSLAASVATRKRGIRMRLSTGSVVSQEDEETKKISMTLSVPQAKVVSSSLSDSNSEEEQGMSGEDRALKVSESKRTGRSGKGRERRGRSGEEKDEEEEYEEGEFVYPSLVDEVESSGQGRRKGSEREDDLWTPQGPVTLVKGSIASSPRQKRNARKRSFEHSLSATAAKIVKLEKEMEEEKVEEAAMDLKPPPPQSRATDPVLGGGSLGFGRGGSKEGSAPANRQARAAAAANAVDAVLSAVRPRSKPQTAKQRLGKILGLKWKK